MSSHFLLDLRKKCDTIELQIKKGDITMTIGERIKAARESANLTQEELGSKCGTTKQTIYKYEIGKVTNIPLDRLEKIAEAVGVSAAYLMGWNDEQGNAQLNNRKNVVRIAGRDGSFIEKNLSDKQVAALKALIDQLPEADDL